MTKVWLSRSAKQS